MTHFGQWARFRGAGAALCVSAVTCVWSFDTRGANVPSGVSLSTVERVLAVVNHDPITLQDVIHTARFELSKRIGSASLDQPLSHELKQSVLEHVIQQRVLLQEAQRFRVQPPSAQEEDEAYQRYVDGFGETSLLRQFLDALDWNPTTVRTELRHEITVEHFLNDRIRARIQVSDAEIATFKTQHPALSTDALAAEALLQERTLERTRAYIAELIARSDIVRNAAP